MSPRVLIAFASKYGATAEIAEKIGEVLRQSDCQVDVMPANHVNEVTAYDAVVLGSAVYTGHWVKEAAQFLTSHEDALAQKPVWLFSSGPTGDGDPVETMGGWRFPLDLQPIADRVNPRDTTLFQGKIDIDKLHLGEKLMVKAVKAQLGDSRDWDAISDWAREIVRELATK